MRLYLRVIETTIPIVLGYPFLMKFNPQVDWRGRWVRIERKGKVFQIPDLPRRSLTV